MRAKPDSNFTFNFFLISPAINTGAKLYWTQHFPSKTSVERKDMLDGQTPISHKILRRPARWSGHSNVSSPRRQNSSSNSLMMRSFRRSFSTRNWPPARGNEGDLFASRMPVKAALSRCTYGQVGRRSQTSLTLEGRLKLESIVPSE